MDANQPGRISQTTHMAVMVSPDYFQYNDQTALSNRFQHLPETLGKTPGEVRKAAKEEFAGMVDVLQSHGIIIRVIPSRQDTPDAVFPNNWFSHHQSPENESGTLILYPMYTANRRAERQVDILRRELATLNISTPCVIDLTDWEKEGKILEGTGSLVLDRVKKVAFAMESPRTTKEAFNNWCKRMGYEPFFFHAYDKVDLPIYHTNVVMSIGTGFAVISPESIKDVGEREALERKLTDLGKEVLRISVEQVYKFCGNLIQMNSASGEPKIILSKQALEAFTREEKSRLERHGELVSLEMNVIEAVGGGSARCTIAEVFPAEKTK